jgi:hypothetical protein
MALTAHKLPCETWMAHDSSMGILRHSRRKQDHRRLTLKPTGPRNPCGGRSVVPSLSDIALLAVLSILLINPVKPLVIDKSPGIELSHFQRFTIRSLLRLTFFVAVGAACVGRLM